MSVPSAHTKKVPDGAFNELAYAMNCALHMNWLRHELHLTVHEETEADSIHDTYVSIHLFR